MSMLTRLPLLLALAACCPPEGLTFHSSTPFDRETAVSADVQPELQFFAEDYGDARPEWLRLRTRAGRPVAGHVERLGDAHEQRLRFVPDAPLPADDYQLVIDDGGEVHADGPWTISFSTHSRPSLLRQDAYATGVYLDFSQAIDLESLRARVAVLDATGQPLAFQLVPTGPIPGVAIEPEGALAQVTIADGALAADGTPLPGLPLTLVPAYRD